ncbi:MAG: methylated-DNA--[protein]-cysteine S-methyltransferase [Acidobacteriota bacterium]
MTSPSESYARVEAAIRYLERHHVEQPELRDVAGALGLSPSYLQRLFRRWAGVSPKRFLQHLTVETAKARLDDDVSLLEASWDVGLSGPSRLHDHFVALEAMTPGEYKAGGGDFEILYGFHRSPFGEVLIAETPRGICHLSFVAEDEAERQVEALARRWHRSSLRRDDGATARAFDGAFGELGGRQRLALLVQGTNFQIQVWRALLRVPPGRLVSYGKVAEAVCQRSAARAVGSAVGANPVAVLIPCHRVLRASGELGEYRWGATRKRALVAWEGARLAEEPA